MVKKNIHVTHRKDGTWAVIWGGAERALGIFDTQKKAIQAARPRARQKKVELVIHGMDNLIRDKDSYGEDPCPPKDKKHQVIKYTE